MKSWTVGSLACHDRPGVVYQIKASDMETQYGKVTSKAFHRLSGLWTIILKPVMPDLIPLPAALVVRGRRVLLIA